MKRLALPLVLAVLGCAGGITRGAFSLSTPASDAVVLAAVTERVRGAAPNNLSPVAAIVADDPTQGLVVVDLGSGALLGRVAVALASRPVVAGNLVIGRVTGSIVAWSLQGSERWRIPDEGLDLVGASSEATPWSSMTTRPARTTATPARSCGLTYAQRTAPVWASSANTSRW
jgi:hypothetical protein